MDAHKGNRSVLALPRALVLALLAPLATSCASRAVQLDTAPTGAQVSIVDAAGAKTLLGTTPLLAEAEALAKPGAAAQGDLLLRIDKEGYLPAYVLLPKDGSGRLEMRFSLEPRGPVVTPLVQEAVRLSFEAERLLMERRYDDARAAAKKIQDRFPALSVGWVVEATALHLQGKKEESLPLWKRALEADPEDPFVARMAGAVRVPGAPAGAGAGAGAASAGVPGGAP